MIIVSIAQGDRRGLPLLIVHIIGTPLACLFASMVSFAAILGAVGMGAGTAAAIIKPTPLLASTAITKPTPLPASTPEPTIAAASPPKPPVIAASIPVLEMFPSKSVVSAITSNQWSGDALIVLGTLKNTNAVPVRIENLSAAGFDKDQKSVIEGSDYTIVHNDLAAGETVNFQVSLKDGTKQIRFVKLTPKVAKQ